MNGPIFIYNPCPICGKLNKQYNTWDAGILGEFYYDCDNCGYFKHMTYGPYKEGINTLSLTKADTERKKQLLEQYKERIIELNLEINPDYIFRR